MEIVLTFGKSLHVGTSYNQAYLFENGLQYLSREAFKSRQLPISCKLAKQVIAPLTDSMSEDVATIVENGYSKGRQNEYRHASQGINHLHDLVIRLFFRSYRSSVSGHRQLAQEVAGLKGNVVPLIHETLAQLGEVQRIQCPS